MKGLLIKYFFLLGVIVSSFTAVAQEDVIRLENCMNESYKVQVDSLKQLFSNQGYEVVREASVKVNLLKPVIGNSRKWRFIIFTIVN